MIAISILFVLSMPDLNIMLRYFRMATVSISSFNDTDCHHASISSRDIPKHLHWVVLVSKNLSLQVSQAIE